MKTITIYTHYALSLLAFGVTHAKCWIEKPNFSHDEDVGYELTVTIPDSAKVTTNSFGDVLLDIPAEPFYIPLFYNYAENRIEGGYYEPIKGVNIVEKIEI